MKFIKKPVVIEAKQFKYTEEGLNTLYQWMGPSFGTYRKDRHPNAKAELEIKTLEDGDTLKVTHTATEGDWIIKGVKGEFYACKPDIFELTYNALE